MKNKEVKSPQSMPKRRYTKGLVIGLSVAVGVLGLSTIGLATAYGCTQSAANQYSIQLENVYQKNMYDLVESVNNTETKLSKILAASEGGLQKKLLAEVAQNTELAENSISSLPISQNSLADSVKFINQMGAYTQSLADKLAQGGSLNQKDLSTLQNLHESVLDMKNQINKFVKKVQQNYSILQQSLNIDGDFNNFTIDMSSIKGEDIDYPVMIYDGPFSDAEQNVTVKGLKGETLNSEQCQKEVEKAFKNYASISYSGEINSRFETFTYHMTNTDNQKLFVQVSKVGGHIITVSGRGNESQNKKIGFDEAKKIALDFAAENGIEGGEVVWHDQIQNDIYLNIAPTNNGIILYPDLVKVKVDLTTSTIVGYDATNYFLNHIPRALKAPAKSANSYKSKLPSDLAIRGTKLVLAPLDYDREVVCFEYECEKAGSTYYVYLNADTGKEENVLKVIQTTDGSKLM